MPQVLLCSELKSSLSRYPVPGAGVGVAGGVGVAVGFGVGVGVAVGFAVGVAVGFAVGVAGGFTVGFGVGVGLFEPPVTWLVIVSTSGQVSLMPLLVYAVSPRPFAFLSTLF